MDKIVISKEDFIHFPEHSFFNYLEEEYDLNEKGFVLSEDVRDNFNKYVDFENYFSTRYTTMMLIKILPKVRKTSREVSINFHEKTRKRGFVGISKKNNK